MSKLLQLFLIEEGGKEKPDSVSSLENSSKNLKKKKHFFSDREEQNRSRNKQ